MRKKIVKKPIKKRNGRKMAPPTRVDVDEDNEEKEKTPMTPEQQQSIVEFLTPIQAVTLGEYSVTFTPPPTTVPVTFTVPPTV